VTTYVAFLRGVNLGPQRKVSMARLAELGRELGYEDVWTWVNSGNLVLTTGEDLGEVERAVAGALEAEYGTSIDVTVRSADALEALLGRNPFPDGSPSQVTVAFLTGAAPVDVGERIARVATDAEPYEIAAREVWVNYSDGIAGSRLAAGFSKVVVVSATTRSLGTVTRIVAKIRARERQS
jgi:uncharacterized protein (DUF1697 family)